MGDIALLLCSEEKEEKVSTVKRVLKLIKSGMSRFIAKDRPDKYIPDENVKKIAINEGFNVYTIKLPNSAERVKGFSSSKKAKIEQEIHELCKQNNIEQCIPPECLVGSIPLGKSIRQLLKGCYLYKSLLLNILNVIYYDRGFKVSELDITIIDGEDVEEIMTYIRLLSPTVKYITVITNRKEIFEQEADRIYDETGLAIGVTSEYKNGFRNADFIINLGGLNERMLNSRVNARALILNYGDLDVSKVLSENTIINGIRAGLPKKILSQIEKELYDYYSETELVELILNCKLNILEKEAASKLDHLAIKNLSDEFKKSGYTIKSFVGRRNNLKIEDIKILKAI